MRFLLYLFVCLCVSGCSSPKELEKPQVKERILDFQKRAFAVRDAKPVMKSVLRVLQEDCYVVRHMSLDLGFLSATKENTTERTSDKFWAGLSKGEKGRWEQQEITNAVISMHPRGGKIAIRAHFQIKTVDNKGKVVSIQHVQEKPVYEDFFARVHKELLVR